jgi:cellulose synthase/poly-beta-1,6-N-acetylglucosamine synthase-like glycosyltransferase
MYATRTILFLIGYSLERKRIIRETSDLPKVSVIVPSRNEEDNIDRCLESIVRVDYPKDKLEIIAVNDRSTDRTGEIISSYMQKYDFIKICNVKPEDIEGNLQGKPGAIQHGADQATGEVILMTDADCAVNPGWVKTIATGYGDPKVGLIASYTLIESETLFEKIQSLEWIYMHTMASGGIGLAQPLGCYGNNLSVRKETFDKLGGYREIPFSVTEDLAVLQAVAASEYEPRYYCHKNATVTTLPEPTFKDYLKQRHRWAVGGQKLGWRAVAFVGTSITMWTGIFASALCSEWGLTAGLIATRLAGDFSLIFTSLAHLRKTRMAGWIFPSVFFFMFIELIIPFVLLDKKIEWKGQTFNQAN